MKDPLKIRIERLMREHLFPVTSPNDREVRIYGVERCADKIEQIFSEELEDAILLHKQREESDRIVREFQK